MSLVLGLVALFVAALAAIDLLSVRAPERFGAEMVLHGEGPFRSGSEPVWLRRETPLVLKVSAGLALVYGVLAFPGTLAPTVLTVLALQRHPIGGDGWTALAAVIVAALSMSAALKTIRAGRMMLELSKAAITVMWRCVAWLGAWNAALLGMALLIQMPEAPVSTIVIAYLAATASVMVVQLVTARIAARHVIVPSDPVSGQPATPST